jgi:hypothetical protein
MATLKQNGQLSFKRHLELLEEHLEWKHAEEAIKESTMRRTE